jgi:DNA-binding transcriptional MocR family regulator
VTASAGDLVGVESPTYFGTLLLLETLGLKAVEIATDPRTGLQVDDLASVLARHRLAAVVASPTCQNPLGSVMPDAAKQRLVTLLTRHDVPLIEDDVYGDAFHGDERPSPAKVWDRKGIVLLCSSFSKLLAPGYRVGWIVGGRYQAAVTRAKLATTLANAALPQMALAAYLRSGACDQFLRRIRRIYRDQTLRGRDAIARSFPAGTRITSPAGGFVLWVEMPAGIDALELAERARGEGIAVSPGPLFSARRQHHTCLRVSCGEPWSKAHDRAVATLGRLASRLRV